MQQHRAFIHVQVPNGDLTVEQLRFLGDCIKPLEGGCGDITTRANIQLRGVTLKEARPACLSAAAFSHAALEPAAIAAAGPSASLLAWLGSSSACVLPYQGSSVHWSQRIMLGT